MRSRARLRSRGPLCLLLALLALLALAGCGGPDFGNFSDELKFGDGNAKDTQTIDRMTIPQGGLGGLIGREQIDWVRGVRMMGDPHGIVTHLSDDDIKDYMRGNPSVQCQALQNTRQKGSPDPGKWNLQGSACVKTRKLSWLEATLWNTYEQDSRDTFSWLSTKRDTLVASPRTVGVLQRHSTPAYGMWEGAVNPYLRVSMGVLAVAAALSIIALGVRVLWDVEHRMEGPLLGRAGWIFLGLFMGSSCVSIVLSLMGRSGTGSPYWASWTPGKGTGFYVSDWVRLQADPFMLIAMVVGVVAAGFKLVTTQEGRGLIPLGKALMWAILTSVLLAGFIELFESTIDNWTASVMQTASDMMRDAWDSNQLAATQFFKLGTPTALLLTLVLWLGGLIGKVFAYFRAGILPILVGVAPTWAAMSWSEQGRQSFAKTLGWLAAFLLYKPVAALVTATGSAVLVTSGAGDDSTAITLTLTMGVVVLLPALIKLVVPAVERGVGGGGPGTMSTMAAGAAGGIVTTAGETMRGGGSLLRHLTGGSGHGHVPDGTNPGKDHGVPSPLKGIGGKSHKPTPPSMSGGDGSVHGSEAPDGVQGGANTNSATMPPQDPAGPDGTGAQARHDSRSADGTPPRIDPRGVPVDGEGPDGVNRGSIRKGGKEF